MSSTVKRSSTLSKTLDDVKYEQYVNNLNDRLPQLVDPSDVDCKRWPWELLQNAKDTVVKRKNPQDRFVDVIIKYYVDNEGRKKLYFEHNGDQFTDKAITGLIWKFSAEKRNEQITEDGLTRDKQSTGRFGTGFMTTHCLSLTVDVSGSLYHTDLDRNVSVDFTLHREGPNDEAYKKGVNMTEEELDENMDNVPIPEGEIRPTRFTYLLNREASEKAADMGIQNVRENAAQTMLFCPSVRSITIIDEIHNAKFEIRRQNNDEGKDVVKETVFAEQSSDMTEPVCRRFISLEIEEPSEEITSRFKSNDNTKRNLRLHVAIEVDKHNNVLPIPSTSPAVYCSLPLIGFESMMLPFYINSNDFEPSTERKSLYLKKKRYEYRTNEDTGENEQYYLQSGINWAILERSVSLYEQIVDYLIDKRYNNRFNLVYGISSVLNETWEVETKNCLAARFIIPLRKMLMSKLLVNTIGGYRSIDSGIKFVEFKKDCDKHTFYDICERIHGADIPVEDENIEWNSLKWSKYSFADDFDEKISDNENPTCPIYNYGHVAKYIEESVNLDNLTIILDEENQDSNQILEKAQKLEWLNKFYGWIKDSKVTNLSDKKIVPNRLGVFCSTESGCELKDARDIPLEIFDFMKRLSIDWDERLLMEGVEHITLVKETKDNIITTIKNRTKEIRENSSSVSTKRSELMPLLLALPNKDNGSTQAFFDKRSQISSLLTTLYKDDINNEEIVTLELSAETWKDTDDWFMGIVAHDIADRKCLDVIKEDDTDEEKASKFCTAEWLSDTLFFMFENGYLHQEDITSNADSDYLALIPDRYGKFHAINELHTQGIIPVEFLNDELNKTNYDIKSDLIYEGFTLNEKASTTALTIADLAKKYNDFFKSDATEEDAISVATYLIYLVPQCGDQYLAIRQLYNKFKKISEGQAIVTNVATSDLDVWKGANEYLLDYLCSKASELGTLEKIGREITVSDEGNFHDVTNYEQIGLKWFNDLATVLQNSKIELANDVKTVPDIYGTLHISKEMVYDGSILNNYRNPESLIPLVTGDLWRHYNEGKIWSHYGEEKDGSADGLTQSIVHPKFRFVNKYQDNTDVKLFSLVDKVIYYCSEHYSPEWKSLLKSSIITLQSFFDRNQENQWSISEDSRLLSLFPNTYSKRKSLSYDFIYDAETKARISKINESFSPEEIEILITDREVVKEILANKDYYADLEEKNQQMARQIEELSNVSNILKDCSQDQLDVIKEFVEKLAFQSMQDDGGETPTGGNDRVVTKIEIVPETYEISVENHMGKTQIVKIDQAQYAGLPLEEIKAYVSDAKMAVVNYYKELNEKKHLGMTFKTDEIFMDSYSQLYGIYDSNGNEKPIVVHSYKGPHYRYFDLNWYDWQLLSKPNSELWVLTVHGLQCIPLYALPVRNYSISINSNLPIETTALLTLAAVLKKYVPISFEFGNNMPQNFNDPVPFDYVPKQLERSVASIKQLCDETMLELSGIFNSGANLPIVRSSIGYSNALKEYNETGRMRDAYDMPANDTQPPVISAGDKSLF